MISPATPRQARAARRRALALALRRRGWSYQQIAEHVDADGVRLFAGRQSAQEAVRRAERDHEQQGTS